MSQKTVLIIDDEEDLLMVLGFSLEVQGFRVLTASSGQEALRLLHHEAIDAVVADVRMPGLSGLKLFRIAREELSSVPPFIFSTGFSDFSLEDAYQEGVEGILVKPFELSEFQKTVERVTLPPEDRWGLVPTQEEPLHPERTLSLELGQMNELLTDAGIRLGRGGLRVQVDENTLRLHERVRFEIFFRSGERPLHGTGRIRWHRYSDPSRWVYGIEFETLEADSRSQVVDFICRSRSAPYIPASDPRGAATG